MAVASGSPTCRLRTNQGPVDNRTAAGSIKCSARQERWARTCTRIRLICFSCMLLLLLLPLLPPPLQDSFLWMKRERTIHSARIKHCQTS